MPTTFCAVSREVGTLCFAHPTAAPTSARIPAAGFARGLPGSPSMRRAQGMPDAQPHPRPRVQQKTHTSSKPQVSRDQPAFPAQWFTGLWRDLPGVRALIATVASGSSSANLTPASGCQDHTLLPSASVRSSGDTNTSIASRFPRP